MSFKDNIDKTRLPKHIAIIMDGNGRWAKERGKDRSFGHRQGVESVRTVTRAAGSLGIDYLTLYTFSTENWSRPEEEVNALMTLMVMAIEQETPDLMKNNVRLSAIGDLERMPSEVRERLDRCMRQTASNTGITLVLALSYSSRWELVRAARFLAAEVAEKHLLPEDINEDSISSVLTTADIPDPDLLIRTGGNIASAISFCGKLLMPNFILPLSIGPISMKRAFTELFVIISRGNAASEKSVNNYDANIHL